MTDISIITRGRGKVLIYEGYEYYKHSDYQNEETLWRCAKYKKTKCGGTLNLLPVVVNEKDSGITESAPVLVTGKVMSLDNEWVFVHKPELYEIAKQELFQEQNEDSIDHNFLHMHIHEIQRDGNIVRTAVTLNKPRLEELSSQHSEKIFIPDLPKEMISKEDTENTMFGYACGMCAAIFQTEKELGSHRETHKMETDKVAAAKQETNFTKIGVIILSDSSKKSKTYACMQCNAKFQRLNNCHRHVRTHMAPVTSAPDGKRVYDCKICYSSFHHAPTLLKHIMKNHIKVDK